MRSTRYWTFLALIIVCVCVLTQTGQAQVPPSQPLIGNNLAAPFDDVSGSAGIANEPPGVGGMGVLGRIGHEAGETVGREQSITYFDLSPYIFVDNYYLFGDTRLFIANNGRAAGNAGLGVRRFFENINSVGGLAFYYDRDGHRGALFEQFGVSGEILTEWLDVRTNVYLPFGTLEKVTDVKFESGSSQLVDNSTLFPGGTGSTLQFQRRTFSATAMEGFDTTFTAPVPGDVSQKFNLEASAGFYYFQISGRDAPEAWGWKLRLDADVADRLSHMFLQFTNDQVFKNNVVFGININYWHNLEPRPRIGHSQYNRMAEWVRRNRHVVAVESSFLNDPEVAINPNTGEPYLVANVRNDPARPVFPVPLGDGSLAMPFQLIQTGIDANLVDSNGVTRQADLVYVQANSVYDSADLGNQVVTMRDNALVLGEGVPLSVPVEGLSSPIPLPTITPTPASRPVIQNMTGPVVTLANSSRFAGFDIINTDGTAILGDSINSSVVEEVRIMTTTGGATADGISLTDTSGVFVFSNISTEGTSGNAFEVIGGTSNIAIEEMSTISNDAEYAVLIQDFNGTFNMRTGTSIVDTGGRGISVRGTNPGDSTGSVTFQTIDISNTNAGAAAPAIEILNHSGGVSFLEAITIDGNNGDNFVVMNLQATGAVAINEAVTIDNRNGHGILVQDIAEAPDAMNPGGFRAGLVAFNNSSATVAINTPAGSPATWTSDPGVRFQSSSGTLLFNGNLTVDGGNGAGIEIANIADTGVTDGQFRSNSPGLITISNTVGPGFNVDNVAKADFNISTAGMSISDRGGPLVQGGIGINITDFAGTANFRGANTVNNELGSTANAVQIIDTNSSDNLYTGGVGFSNLTVNDLLGANPPPSGSPTYGVLVASNRNPVVGEQSSVDFNVLNIINAEDAIAVAIIDNNGNGVYNDNVSIGAGVIESENGRGIDVQGDITYSQHDIEFQSISASDADFGIRVQNSAGRFFVVGTSNASGAGGLIENMSSVGAEFLNTQQVDLSWMTYQANNIGITGDTLIQRVIPQEEGTVIRTPQFNIRNTEIDGTTNEAIIMTDVSTFLLENSLLTDNGRINPSNQIQYLATVDEFDIDNDDEDEIVEYSVTLDGNTVSDNPGASIGTGIDLISIETANTIGGDGVPLDLMVINNGPPPAGTNTISSNRTNAAAVHVDWEGEFTALFQNNIITLQAGNSGTPSTDQIGVELIIDGISDVTYQNNSLNSQAIGLIATFNTGLDFTFAQAATVDISNNVSFDDTGLFIPQSGFSFAGSVDTAMDFTFQSSGNSVNIDTNLIEFGTNAFQGTAIRFSQIFSPSSVTVNNNVIQMTQTLNNFTDRGISFVDVRGEINIDGTDNSLDSASLFVIPFEPTNTQLFNGQITINGNAFP